MEVISHFMTLRLGLMIMKTNKCMYRLGYCSREWVFSIILKILTPSCHFQEWKNFVNCQFDRILAVLAKAYLLSDTNTRLQRILDTSISGKNTSGLMNLHFCNFWVFDILITVIKVCKIFSVLTAGQSKFHDNCGFSSFYSNRPISAI